MENDPRKQFEEAGKERPPSLLREIFEMLAENKKWWMIPIIGFLLIIGLLILAGGSSAAPFIYTLF